MTLRYPGFLRRQWRLFEARRALLHGSPEEALTHLRDPCLALSRSADQLRARVVDVLFRQAARRAGQGRDASVARILGTVAGEDPARAAEWRERFAPQMNRHEPSTIVGAVAAPPTSLTARVRKAVDGLLSEMRGPAAASPGPGFQSRDPDPGAEPSQDPACDASPASSTPEPDDAPERAPVAEPDVELPNRFHLAVDDGGEFLVATGPELVIGHSRAARADLLFLADLESRHAKLVWAESFHGGPSWSIEPIGAARVQVNGRPLKQDERSTLFDGDHVELASNLAFQFRMPEYSSSSAIVELLHGAECEGAVRILLFGPGEAGRVRIGSSRNRHIPVADLDHEVVLVLEGTFLRVGCEGGVKVLGTGPGGSQAGSLSGEVRIGCPTAGRTDLLVAARAKQGPPFGFSLRAVDGPEKPPRAGKGRS